jgi:proline iminopeptidase
MKIKWLRFTTVILTVVLSHAALAHSIRDGRISVDGVGIYYKIVGKGEPVFILHGGPGMFHDYFLPYLEPLAAKYRLVFSDQRGNGRSPMEITASTYTFPLLVRDIEELRKALGLKKIHLMGHSFGGYLAMRYAVGHSGSLKSLILVDSAPPTLALFIKSQQNRISRYTPEEQQEIQAVMAAQLKSGGDAKGLNHMLRLTEKVSFHDPKRVDEILSHVKFTDTTAKNLISISRLQASLIADYDNLKNLDKIPVPTLVLHGESDFIPAESHRIIHEMVRGSRLVSLPECGHYPFAETPGPFLQKVSEFLESIR